MCTSKTYGLPSRYEFNKSAEQETYSAMISDSMSSCEYNNFKNKIASPSSLLVNTYNIP